MPHLIVGDLEIAYAAPRLENGTPVLLIHGWPDDPSTWDGILQPLASAGFRPIVPSLRGFGETRFLAQAAPRTGNSGILAMDAIGLMDGLGIERFAVVGHDWGSNVAEALAVGWPDRIERIAMLATPPRLGGMPTPPFWHAQREWYHWFMATPRGAQAVRDDRRRFAHLHWVNWSPLGWFDESTFAQVAEAWDNPDWVDVTLHSYRSRWDVAASDPRSSWLEAKIKATKTLSLPAMYVQGAADGVNPPEAASQVPGKFAGPFHLLTLEGVGHFPQREAPAALAAHLLSFLAGELP
jgi:pimeloyl-ACP methyl ester carboxylesterase